MITGASLSVCLSAAKVDNNKMWFVEMKCVIAMKKLQ